MNPVDIGLKFYSVPIKRKNFTEVFFCSNWRKIFGKVSPREIANTSILDGLFTLILLNNLS